MSSPYSTLNNRPIDQWKVTELKEELRRRRLKTNGLKEELVKRLDGALRSDMEETEEEKLGNGLDPDNDPVDEVDEEKSTPALEESNAEPDGDKDEEADEEKSVALPRDNSVKPVEDKSGLAHNGAAMVDHFDSVVDVKQLTEDEDQKEMGHTSLEATDDTTESAVSLKSSMTDSQIGVGQLESSDQDATYGKTMDSKPSAEDVTLTVSEPNNQVSEVSPDLGLKSESISTDSVSINEKNELKDNLNANNVNLELEVIKPEMVQPSSSDVPTIDGDSHPSKDDKEVVDNQASLEEAGDATCATYMEVCRKIEGVDGGSPEKLNLDRSSGDESMEEDVLDSKQIESKNNSVECERKEDIKEDMTHVVNPNEAAVGGFSPEQKGMVSEEEIKPIAATEKRKAEDQEAVDINNEPKRQRRWNSTTVKAPEPQMSNVTTSTKTKDAFQPALRRSFSRSDSSVSADAPKERIVPPSQKPATTSLRIDRFLRPFTLKAVQELLVKTGSVTDFWMDQIKTHCYVTYSSVEEATATRNALYNLQWPTNGGRLLVAEFVDPQEVKMRLETPQSPAAVTPSPSTPTAPPFQRQPQAPPPSRPVNLRQQQLPPPPPLPPPPALSNPPPVRERLPPPPPPPKKVDPPIMTLDDLFKKTKTTPRIYYLPLSEEQVAAKLPAEQGKRTREEA